MANCYYYYYYLLSIEHVVNFLKFQENDSQCSGDEFLELEVKNIIQKFNHLGILTCLNFSHLDMLGDFLFLILTCGDGSSFYTECTDKEILTLYNTFVIFYNPYKKNSYGMHMVC